MLRDYQKRVINKIRNAYIKGYRAPILRLDCGAGKTITTLWMAIESAKRGNEVLFLVHRKELLQQTLDTLSQFEHTDKIKVGMILTVGNHLEDYNPNFIICDECNFALSKSWRKVLDHYPNAYKLGLSATPCRLDGKPMGDIFDTIIEDVDANWLIENHYLAPYDYYAPKITGDLKTRGSDFDMDVFAKSAIYGNVFNYCDNKHKTIIYAPTIAFSVRLCEELNERGFPSMHFDANTPKKERDEIIKKFKNGDIKFLLNVDLISFGFDCPSCDRVFILRPTMSLALYIQQSMRCLRYEEGKKSEIYDFVGNVFRHGLPTEHRDWDLTTSKKIKASHSVDELKVRMCAHCLLVYKGVGAICPHCGYNNGKTRKEIKQEEQAELERVERIEKLNARFEVATSRTLQQLIDLATKRGYKNPWYWAQTIINARQKKVKNKKNPWYNEDI